MSVTQPRPAAEATTRSERSWRTRLMGGGTEGNERLTAATGGALMVLLAVIGITILRLGQLLSVHLFVGMLLLGPVVLKLGSTGYRFARYYTGNERYRRSGPPATPLRLIAPMVVLSTVTVFATGVALLFIGPSSRDTLLPIHKISFFVWVGFTGLHVLGHLQALPNLLRSDYTRSPQLGPAVRGRDGRAMALASALLAGVVLAVLVIPEFGPWLSHMRDHR